MRVVGRSVMTLPQFCDAPLAKRLEETGAATGEAAGKTQARNTNDGSRAHMHQPKHGNNHRT